MSHVAQATNILQAETNAQMGWLLPTIHLLQIKLDKVKLQLKYCRPLVDSLQSGIQNRFGHMFKDAELVAAAILLPKFRTTRTKGDATIKMGIDYIKQHLEDPNIQPGDATRSSSSDEDDFFSSLQASKTQDCAKQFDAYLSCSADHMDLLRSFPSVCKLSVKLNTPLPASAACERLFSKAGPFCNRTWDGWMCWDDSPPGTSMQMCPSYFIDFDPSETVTKICNPDGQWFHHPESKRVWSNYTLCSAHSKDKLKFTLSLYYLAMAGHGISIVSLIVSLVIFSYLKSLSCQRISLHKNMFISFIFNSVFTMGWLSMTSCGSQTISAINPVSCKILATLVQYTATSNYFWMLCEGIYLHTLIIVAVFVGEQQLFWYYVLGWVFPIFPAITYALARGFYFNDTCWISANSHLVYIIHGPIHAALFVNLFFLLNVIRVLITKLRKTHCAESTAYMKAVRATLILIPLLGVQYILMPWIPDIYDKQVIYIFVSVLSNFQGLLVSIILCFCNAEAQTALRRKWVQWKIAWGKTGLGETPFVSHHFNCHTTSSIVETSRATCSAEVPAEVPSHRQTETCHLMPVGQQESG